MNSFQLLVTSMAQLINDERSWAFSIILNMLEGACDSSYISDTPPVKSSMASHVVPPFKAS